MSSFSHLRKMKHKLDPSNLVQYRLVCSDHEEDLNQYIGKKITIRFQDQINCIECGREINKSFNQGYCFPCLQNLAECDICIVKPELCHFDKGTCRDDEFAQEHCNILHSIYLSLTSAMKIGITRQHCELSRWIDQGASQALRLISVKRRYHAGLIEVELAKNMPDKTNWQKMLKNESEYKDLQEEKKILLEKISTLIRSATFVEDLTYILEDQEILGTQRATIQEIKYPVLEYPQKVKSFNLDKDPLVEGTLLGIKGQYLILDTGVINLRKYAGYLVSIDFQA